MDFLERLSTDVHKGYFVDLYYVRQSDSSAIDIYKKLGYSLYRQVIGYYNNMEDAYGMRNALP